MKVALSLGVSMLQAWLDSGSTHNFILEAAAARCGLKFEERTGLQVAVANGERLPCLGGRVHDQNFTVDLFVLPLAGYDIVLGTQWLASPRPIWWDFSRLTMAFWWRDHHVEWSGLADSPRHRLHALTSPTTMEALLHNFEHIFAKLQGLPPPHPCDYRIHLLPGTPPVAVRP
ncbi:hypothetical protein U9M48_035232 [Paspalum notatum var. saurae]|uniref:Uncharacterized protein n=1 Tax=Paspalum notatum var. saurae TaxID=547442 RepID=A0AAQ3X9T7_PASNO